METRRYPVDTQTFSTIIENKCVYVDKTDLVYKLTNEYRYVFLSRPRRFGKSLLCSTLKEYFDGNKDLFKGLKIDALEKEWVKYPVIHLDFSNDKSNDINSISATINEQLSGYEKLFGISNIAPNFNIRLTNIVKTANNLTGNGATIIIDEYDAYMLNAIDNQPLQSQVRTVMTNLFSPLKELDKYIRFVFITGITKFSQMSIFSSLNNLQDISLMPEYEAVCGITMDELLTTLKAGLQDFADKNGYTFDETVRYFKTKYDGYHFSPKMMDVFNPYSVIKALNEKRFSDFWFNSGTPTALLRLIAKFDLQMEDYEGVECGESRFNKPVEKVTDLVPFLFQAGYLTIKDYRTYADDETVLQTYTLGYPNGEVRMAFANCLYTDYYKATENIVLRDAYIDFKISDNIDTFIEHLKAFFDDFPFSLNNMNEKHYHSIIYTILTSFGANIAANRETALGKADLVLYMPKTIYVIELKYDQSLKTAKKQLQNRRYAKAYLDSGKRIVKLAIKFSSKERNIESYEAIEEAKL